jgi:hypothetical protein
MLPRDESRWCRIESVDGNRELLEAEISGRRGGTERGVKFLKGTAPPCLVV